MSEQLRRELLSFIDSLKPLYPGGIPERYMKEDPHSPSRAEAPSMGESPVASEEVPLVVLFLTREAVEKEELDLITAAATKGLQLRDGTFAIKSWSEAPLPKARLYVAMGGHEWEGSFREIEGRRTLCTVTAREALSSRSSKKKLWDHLQLLIPLIPSDS